MKRKAVSSKSGAQNLFSDQVFVLSKTNPNKKHLESKITSLGGKVVDKITKNVTYFVQDYSVDDDGRLATVKKHQGKVVSPVFIDRCESAGRILDFHEYAIGLPSYEESVKKPKIKKKSTKKEEATNDDELATNGEKSKDEKTKDENSKEIEKAFQIPENIYNELFVAIRDSDREDEELPQTFDNYLEMPDKNRPTKIKKYIYILPIGYDPMENGNSNSKKKERKGDSGYQGIGLNIVEEFLQAFFGTPTKILPQWEIKQARKKFHIPVGNKSYPISSDSQNRLQVMDILEVMWGHIPKDACCVVGLTLHDIFEIEEDENQFWGRATGDGCGVISLHRFNPDLFDGGKKDENLILSMSRSLNTIVHETMHVFGIDHCVFYKCNMNSSEPILTNIDETLHLCPIDLRKLHHTFQFDIMDRYKKLLAFYKKYNFKYEENWMTKRLNSL